MIESRLQKEIHFAASAHELLHEPSLMSLFEMGTKSRMFDVISTEVSQALNVLPASLDPSFDAFLQTVGLKFDLHPLHFVVRKVS